MGGCSLLAWGIAFSVMIYLQLLQPSVAVFVPNNGVAGWMPPMNGGISIDGHVAATVVRARGSSVIQGKKRGAMDRLAAFFKVRHGHRLGASP